jgi:hypothetical protein
MNITTTTVLAMALAVALGGCASMQDLRNRCSAMGYPEGSPDHAYCTEREVERYRQSINDSLRSFNQAIQQYNQNVQQNRPHVCTSTGPYQLRTTTCY